MVQPRTMFSSEEGPMDPAGRTSPQQHRPERHGRTGCPYETCVVTNPTTSRFALMMLRYFMNNATINTPLDRFDCPVAKCMWQFTEPLEFVRHLFDCPELSKGEFECRKCETWHKFPTTEKGWLEFSGWGKMAEKKKRSSFTEKLKVIVRSSQKLGSPQSRKRSGDSCDSRSTPSSTASWTPSDSSAGSPYNMTQGGEPDSRWPHSADDSWNTRIATCEKPPQISTAATNQQPLYQLDDSSEPLQELCDTAAISCAELPDSGLSRSTQHLHKVHSLPPPYQGKENWHVPSVASVPLYSNTLANSSWMQGPLRLQSVPQDFKYGGGGSHDNGQVSAGMLRTDIEPCFGHNLSESPVGVDMGQLVQATELSTEETRPSQSYSFSSMSSQQFSCSPLPELLAFGGRTNYSSMSSNGSFQSFAMGGWTPNGEPIFSTFEAENEGQQAILLALQEINGSPPDQNQSCHFDLGHRQAWNLSPEIESPSPSNQPRAAPVGVSPAELEHNDDEDLACGLENCEYRPSGTKLHNYRKYLHKHRETHKRARYECDRCGSGYTRPDNLKKHRREKHGIEETRGYGITHVPSRYRRSSRIVDVAEDGLGRYDTLRISKCARR